MKSWHVKTEDIKVLKCKDKRHWSLECKEDIEVLKCKEDIEVLTEDIEVLKCKEDIEVLTEERRHWSLWNLSLKCEHAW